MLRTTPSSRAVARSSPRLGAAARSATQLGATPTRSRAGIIPFTSPPTAFGLLPGWMGETKSFAGGSVGCERVGVAAEALGVGEVPAGLAGVSWVPTAAGWRGELHPTITIAANRTDARLVMAASVPTCGRSGANLGDGRA